MTRRLVLVLALSLVFTLATSCDSADDAGGSDDLVPGFIYNSNDGECDISGAALDFYFDLEFMATVQSGRNVKAFSTVGDHHIQAFLAGTDTLVAEFDFYVNKSGWWVYAGCPDGSHPA